MKAFRFNKGLDNGSLPKRRVVCRAIEVGISERSIRGAKKRDDRNSRQEFSEIGDQALSLQPWGTVPDNDNSDS